MQNNGLPVWLVVMLMAGGVYLQLVYDLIGHVPAAYRQWAWGASGVLLAAGFLWVAGWVIRTAEAIRRFFAGGAP